MSQKRNHLYIFDEYAINLREENLWRGNDLVEISPKVFELLLLLVKKQGEVVLKSEIIESLWKDAFVEEGNISQNIYTLRQLFGNEKKFIETVPKKGYRFIEPVKIVENDLAHNSATRKNEDIDTVSQKTKSRRKFIYFSGALLIVLAFIGIVAFGYFTRQKSIEYSLSNLEIKSLTDTGDVISPTISPDGKFVAYLKRTDAEYKLHLKDLESNNDVEIGIENGVKPGFISFAPDGKRIFFRTIGSHLTSQKIYDISYFGGTANLFADDVWGYFSFSPDGEKMAFYRELPTENKQHLIVKNLSNGEEKVVLERSLPQRFYLICLPVWSPDSTKIATIPTNNNPLRSKLNIFDLETGKEDLLETNLNKISQFEWLPDADKMLALVREEDKGWQLWQISYPDGKSQKVTNDLNSYQGLSLAKNAKLMVLENRSLSSNVYFYPQADIERGQVLTNGDFGHFGLFALDVMPTGKILYDGRGKLKRDLWIIDPATSSRRRLFENNDAFVMNLSSTKDGKYVYLVSDIEKLRSIWRVDVETEKAEKVDLDDNQINTQPALSPDGKWLYFVKQNKKSNAIWRKSLSGNEVQKFFEPKDFAFGNFLAISPNGKYAAFHYLEKKDETENSSESSAVKTKIGFLNLSNIKDIKIREIDSTYRFIVWSNKGETFDYIENSTNGGQIKRLSLINENKPAETVFQSPTKQIFRFAWSADKKDLTIAQGESQSNAVLLKFSN